MIHTFGDYVVDMAGYEIRRAGTAVPVEPQVFDVIAYLIAHNDRVVPKEELLDNIWGDRFVSESALTSRIKAARRALGDDGSRQSVIRTAHGRGYRFVGDLQSAHATRRAASGLVEPLRFPAPVTSFVGRTVERGALVARLAEHRMVTAVGPGGIGKTRLALSVAADVARTRPDGAWFVDLVHVTDPAMVAATIAEAVGVPEQRAASIDDAVLASLERRDGLLVVDNCEHLVDGARECIGRILTRCPRVTVLATSRIRLMTPYEHVYAVPGLSVTDDGGDAVTLFAERVAQVTGGTDLPDMRRTAALCRALDGMALAIELAAARYPSLGLDGLEASLDERLRVLASGVLGDRHGSLRDAIAWSYDLLDVDDQALLCNVAVFAASFDVESAWAVAAPQHSRAAVADICGRLADHSLLVVDHREPTRYRALESIRQFGVEHLERAGQLEAVRERHERWCRDVGSSLIGEEPDAAWCERLDDVVDDLRAAVLWASGDPARVREASRLAAELAALLFLRGRPREAQLRFEQAAARAPDRQEQIRLLRLAAGAATSRYVGDDALRLLHDAAGASIAAGDPGGAARDLSWMTIYIVRSPGILASIPTAEEADALRAEAARLADGSPAADAAVATAIAYGSRGAPTEALGLALRAVELAQGSGDLLMESAAYDQLTAVHIALGDLPESVAVQERREAVMEQVPIAADSGFEHSDFRLMTSEVHLGVGDFRRARHYADLLAALPFHRDEEHLAEARRLKVDALAGEFSEVLTRAQRFRLGWERAGRPVVRNLGASAYAVAMVHGMLGDDVQRSEWVEITTQLGPTPEQIAGCFSGWAPVFDALFELHIGRPAAAIDRMALDIDHPDMVDHWHTQLWRPWYAALWAEATVLDGRPDVELALERSRVAARHNRIAREIVERAVALATGERDRVARCVEVFAELGCRYQAERTRSLLGWPPARDQ